MHRHHDLDDARALDAAAPEDEDEDEPLDGEQEHEADDADEPVDEHDEDEDDEQDGSLRTRSTVPAGGAWEICLTERGEDGQWRTVGEAVDGLRYMTIACAHENAEARNKREF